MARPKSDPKKRFWSKVAKAKPNQCWEWTASKLPNGYGQFTLDGKNFKAHRVAYQFHHDEPPGELCVCHACDNPGCVNPKHLFLGTMLDNVNDQISKGRRHSVFGETNGMSKLTINAVKKIRRDYARGDSQRVIADRYSITQGHVSDVVTRKRWSHV